VAAYTARVAEKLRALGLMCNKMRTSMRTVCSPRTKPKYATGALVELPYPTHDTPLMTNAAIQAVERIFWQGYRYSKAEVLLLDLRQPGEFTDDLFAQTQPEKGEQLMQALDTINARWDRVVKIIR
jgi:DNA polymerase V